MITDIIVGFLNLITNWMASINNYLPNINWEKLDTVKSYFDVVRYVIPVGALLPIVLFIIGIGIAKIIISIIKLIIYVIPLW